MAIVIAWTGLLSMFPLALALYSLVGLLVQDPSVQAAVQDAVMRAFPGQAAGEVQEALRTAHEGASTRGIIGLGGLLVGGSALFGAMADAFNQAYRVRSRGMLQQRLMAIGMIFLFSVLAVISLLASGIAYLLLAIVQGALPVDIPGLSALLSLVAWAVSLLTAFVLFLAIYRVVPNAGQRLGEVWPGAALAAVLFFALGQLFPLYVRYFGGFGQYAVFGFFFLVMTWFYFLAQVLMLGVELNAFLARPGLREPERPPALRPSAEASGRKWEPAAEQPTLVKRLLFGSFAAGVSWALVGLTLLAARQLDDRE